MQATCSGSVAGKHLKRARPGSFALRREVIMFDQACCKSRLAFAATTLALAVLTAGDALASQGPGGGLGTAGAITQTVMAIMV
jgi:hypothetical protein